MQNSTFSKSPPNNSIEDFNLECEITTQWKGKITPNDNEWFMEDQHIYFNKLNNASADFIKRLKIVFAYRAQKYAYHTITNDYYRIASLLKSIPPGEIDISGQIAEKHLIAWRSELAKHNREYQLGALKGMLLESKKYLNKPLINIDAERYLNRTTLKGNPKGSRVNDPETGRMTLAERQIFETKAKQAFEKKIISPKEFLTLILFNSFGIRLIDYTSLKVGDIKIETTTENKMKATIDIPCGKSGQTPRSRISKGNTIDNDAIVIFSNFISGRNKDLPLFESDSITVQTGILAGHMTLSSASYFLESIIEKINIGFHLNSYRFRYSVGTEAYRETGNPYVAATVLRHSDIQNVKVYANEIILAQAHDRVAAESFKDLSALIDAGIRANTFSGIIISKQNFDNARIIAVRAREQIGNFKEIGGCQGDLSCTHGSPIACYCCSKFRPIKEANHFEMLCATLENFFSINKEDPARAASLISAILGMAQVCHLTGQGLSSRRIQK